MGARSVAKAARSLFGFASVGAVLLLLAACPNPLQATLAQVVKDYSTPLTTPSAPSGSGIARTTPVVVSFTESMDTATLTLGGTMAAESNSGRWSSTSATNDTLTVSPLSQWSPGSGKVLIVNCKDLQGYNARPVVLTLGVLDGVVYVRALDGSDTNPGTPDLPKLTINSAIALAARYYTTAEVHVAQGVYNVSYQSGTHVVMAQGISLMGGYDPNNWQNRVPATFVSKIKDTSTAPSAQKYRAVDCGTNLSPSTVLDGFTIVGGGGTGTISVGVYCDASNPTIQNNDMNGGSGDTTAGLRITNASPLVQNNAIDGGGGVDTIGVFTYNSSSIIKGNTICWGQGSNSAYGIINTQSTPKIEGNTIGGVTGMPYISTGIYNDASNAVIVRNTIDGGFAYTAVTGIDNGGGSVAKICNNTIHAGLGASGQQVNSFGISNAGSSAIIQSNTIDIGNPGQGPDALTYSQAIGINISSCAPVIDDNIIFYYSSVVVANQYQYGVIEAGTLSVPAHFYNNDVYNCPSGLYWRYGQGSPDTNFTAINLLSWAKTNISANPVFQSISWPNPNWHLTASSPTSVTQGGCILTGADLLVDKDKVTRTNPWSIGTYEY